MTSPYCDKIKEIEKHIAQGALNLSTIDIWDPLILCEWGRAALCLVGYLPASPVYPPDASSTLCPSCDSQKCLWAVPTVSGVGCGGQNCLQLKTTDTDTL